MLATEPHGNVCMLHNTCIVTHNERELLTFTHTCSYSILVLFPFFFLFPQKHLLLLLVMEVLLYWTYMTAVNQNCSYSILVLFPFFFLFPQKYLFLLMIEVLLYWKCMTAVNQNCIQVGHKFEYDKGAMSMLYSVSH